MVKGSYKIPHNTYCRYLFNRNKTKTRLWILKCQTKPNIHSIMSYCGCASDCLTADVWSILVTVALCRLVDVEWMVADRGLNPGVVLRCWLLVWMWMGVCMWVSVWSSELCGNAILGRRGKLGRCVSLSHGWIWGCRCVLVTLCRERNSPFEHGKYTLHA